MWIFQSIVGYLIMLLGLIQGFINGDIITALIGATAGFILISLSKVVEYLQDISYRSLGISLSARQINQIIMKSRHVPFRSKTLELHPRDGKEYPFFKLDGEYYVRAKMFVKYLSQVEREYTLSFPEREQLKFICALQYSPEVNMFEVNEQVYIKMSSLNVYTKFDGNSVFIENS